LGLPACVTADRNEEILAIFHHKSDNNRMKVVEKDKVIIGMLRDELEQAARDASHIPLFSS